MTTSTSFCSVFWTIQSLICCRMFTRYALSCSSVVTSMPSPYLFLRSKDSGG